MPRQLGLLFPLLSFGFTGQGQINPQTSVIPASLG
jgi:hypothetical protein